MSSSLSVRNRKGAACSNLLHPPFTARPRGGDWQRERRRKESKNSGLDLIWPATQFEILWPRNRLGSWHGSVARHAPRQLSVRTLRITIISHGQKRLPLCYNASVYCPRGLESGDATAASKPALSSDRRGRVRVRFAGKRSSCANRNTTGTTRGLGR